MSAHLCGHRPAASQLGGSHASAQEVALAEGNALLRGHDHTGPEPVPPAGRKDRCMGRAAPGVCCGKLQQPCCTGKWVTLIAVGSCSTSS